jgi:hypothetical protein
MATQKDNRYTNLTVDDILVARRIVTDELKLNTLRAFKNVIAPHGDIKTIDAEDVESASIQGASIQVTSDSKQTNVLYTQNPSAVVAGTIPQFSTNGITQTVPMSLSVLKGDLFAYMFMSGSDGNVTINTPFQLTRDYYYDTLTVGSSGVIDMNGYMIFCKTALINNGVFRVSGGAGSDAAGALGGAGGAPSAVVGEMFVAFGGSNGGNAGVDGAIGPSSTVSVFGGIGGTGGNSATNSGGFPPNAGVSWFNNDTILQNISFFSLLGTNSQTLGLGAVPALGGSGGAGGAATGGGGAGAGGGWIVVAAKSVSGSGTFESRGGNGGAGGADGGGGGGGGGGIVYILSASNSLSPSQVQVQGGLGGSGGAGAFAGTNGQDGRYQNSLL